MQAEMREKQLNIRLSEEEADRFQLVADHYGLNIAGTIRMLFKREADRLAAEAKDAAQRELSQRAWDGVARAAKARAASEQNTKKKPTK